MSLGLHDASLQDVINDLCLLKAYCGEKNIVKSQAAADAQQKIEGIGAPYQVTGIKCANGSTELYQSITAMKAYEKYSFEVRDHYG